MPEVTGNLRDITNGSLDSREGTVIFTLSSTGLVVGNGGIRPDNSREVEPNPETGEFSINLVQTTNMVNDAWYNVSVRWLGDAAALTGYLDLKVRVPASGGRLDELIDPFAQAGPNGRVIWVSQSPPPKPKPWMLWLQQEPGPNPDPFDPKNTSNLWEWRP